MKTPWKSPGSNHTARIHLADWKDCALSTHAAKSPHIHVENFFSRNFLLMYYSVVPRPVFLISKFSCLQSLLAEERKGKSLVRAVSRSSVAIFHHFGVGT